ncbi:MAG: site-specific integrase [Deltaproteobacteria bacterium]|nr:site-specific integrase [Deltaproteobacteria bacterium]
MPGLITKRGKRRWRASIMVGGQLCQKLYPDATKKSYREAVAWETEEKERIEKKKTAMVSWTILSWSDEYLDFAKNRFSIKTYKEKRTAFGRLLKKFGAYRAVSELEPSDCMSHLQRQQKNRSGYAANKDRKNLAAGWEYGRKYLKGFPQGINPFRAVEKFPEIESPRYVPPEEDFWTVYDVSQGQDKAILLTFLHLAARRGEVWGIRIEDLDFSRDQVRLWTHKRKGGKKEADWLPITGELKTALMEWLRVRPVETEHLFVCLEPLPCLVDLYGKPFVTRQKFMKKLCKRAGVKPFGLHAIRHLTASTLYAKGYSLAHIQAVLRHKNPKTTERYLQKLGLEQVRDALNEGLKRSPKAQVVRLRKTKNETKKLEKGKIIPFRKREFANG